jgi:hypothetical protein
MINNTFRAIDTLIKQMALLDALVSKFVNLLFVRRQVSAACINYLYTGWCMTGYSSVPSCGVCGPEAACYTIQKCTYSQYVQGRGPCTISSFSSCSKNYTWCSSNVC